MRYIGVLILALVLGVASPASAGEPLAADTALATASGATFTAPTGWQVATAGNKNILEPPEADSRLALVDVQAANADAAVAAGWAAYRADANRPLRLATPQAPYNGWEERRIFSYETSPNEKAVVYAMAWRAGQDWTVVIVDASRATFEKRYAAFSLVTASLRPKGYRREQFADRKAHPLDAERIAVLKDFVRNVMEKFDIPGVGLSLIDNGKVVFEGGFGVKTLGKPDPVDADTLFLAASNTKAMTTLLLAELVDERKMRWDQPVTELYPPFRLGDAETTRQVLVKHLVCACTGLPRQDFEWLFNFGLATPLSSLASLATMQPTSRFGEAYQYSNPMAAAAGYVGAHVVDPQQELGAAYDAAMRSKVFGPLGMTNTTFDFVKVLVGNAASPHDLDIDGKTVPARMDINYSVVPIRPAGGMWTSPRELAKYLQMELALGRLPDGTQLVSKESLLERRKSQIRTGEDQAYGMGLWINTQYGIPIVSHGGSLFGYKSDMIFLPDHGVGAVILTNSDSGGNLTWLLRRRLLEVLFDGKPEAVEQARVAAEQRLANRAKWRERLVVPPAAAEVEKLAARYSSPALGTLSVRRQGDATIFDFGTWRSAVASRRNDDGTTSFITIDPTVDGFTFVVGEHDGKRALVIRDSQHEYPLIESSAP
ncbi:MAG: beta-lactamase family protein [Reyranella sp.]|uniref:serine hydrolase domain-containing protein n=1 Tax=Reyranella sp. TaxID=1929291 RepID=UPI001ACB6709|nr:serine hydrolase domain-containing protein [Reyranella sp.]MBN9090765.1 beta-lactamase family protein [Reyranella sp.]